MESVKDLSHFISHHELHAAFCVGVNPVGCTSENCSGASFNKLGTDTDWLAGFD